MLLSVIIPSYNRKDFLLDTLNTLSRQTLSVEKFEVIVVDDGSTQDITEVCEINFPFRLIYHRQKNQGDAKARNYGVSKSKADLVVFLDDDMLVDENYLLAMVDSQFGQSNVIVMGTTHFWSEVNRTEFQEFYTKENLTNSKSCASFVDLCSNNMSIHRKEYLKIGGMDNLGFTGSSIWCDVDFAYRAFKLGFKFYRTPEAIAYERDYVSKSLKNAITRGYHMAYRSSVLFRKHSDLIDYLPMFNDKTSITWNIDKPKLILRKLVRYPASTKTALFILEQFVPFIEKLKLSPVFLHAIYRWIIGGYIFRGYRDGLLYLESNRNLS